MSYYIFVIDTNSYSGNFERDITAYCTGQIGECGVGESLVEDDVAERFENLITSMPDEHGCQRPCEIFLDKNKEYNSVAIFFSKRPEYPDIKFIKKRAVEFSSDKNIKIKGFRLFEQPQPPLKLLCEYRV